MQDLILSPHVQGPNPLSPSVLYNICVSFLHHTGVLNIGPLRIPASSKISFYDGKTVMNKQNVCLRPGSTNINWTKSLLQMTKWYFVANRRALEYLLCASGASKCE